MDPVIRAVLLAVFCVTVAFSTSDFENGTTTVDVDGFLVKKMADLRVYKVTHIPLKRIDANAGCFVGKIAVGSEFKRGSFLSSDPPSNKYEVVFDTLTSNSWMFGMGKLATRYGSNRPQGYSGSEGGGGIPRSPYNCDMSKSASNCQRGGGFMEAYPDGSSYEGGFVTDSMTIGPYNLPKVRMGLINKIGTRAYIMRGNQFDGIVGLGPFGWSTHGLTSVFAGIKSSADDALEDATFSFYVSNSMQSGEITFGGHNQRLLADRDGAPGVFSYVETVEFQMCDEDVYNGGVPQGMTCDRKMKAAEKWGVPIDIISANGKKFGGKARTVMHAVIDTAAPHGLTVPGEKYMEFLKKIIGHGVELTSDMELVIDCHKLEDLTPLVIKFGEGVEATFEPREYFPFEINVGSHRKKCASFFVFADEPYYGVDGLWGIGLRFIKKYYVQFQSRHFQPPMIGFARSTGDDIPYVDKTGKKKEAGKKKRKGARTSKQRGKHGNY